MYSCETILRDNTSRNRETTTYTSRKLVEEDEETGMRRGTRSRSRSAVRYTPPQTYGTYCVPLGAHIPGRGGFTAAVEIRGEIRPPLWTLHHVSSLWKGAHEVTWKPSSRNSAHDANAHVYIRQHCMLTSRGSRDKIDLHKWTPRLGSTKTCARKRRFSLWRSRGSLLRLVFFAKIKKQRYSKLKIYL